MGALRLYNTRTRKKEVFEPLEPGIARVYTCGPTVYAPPHIGNLRSNLFADLVVRALVIEGYAGEVNQGSGIKDAMLTYITDQFRLTVFESLSWGQLFDLHEDPHELNNLWDDSRHQSLKHELIACLLKDSTGLRDTSAARTGPA